jgi:uncharacterized membrane protein
MSWYTFLLFLHVSAAAVWVGGGAMIQFFALRVLGSTSGRIAEFARDVEWVGNRVLTGAAGVALLSGIFLVIEGPWTFGDDWIVIGLALFAVTFLGGAFFFGPESGRIGRLIGAEGSDSPEVARRIRRILVLSRLDLILLFLILYDMAVKPEFDDAGAIALGLGLAVLAWLLVLWRLFAVAPPATAAE